MHVFNWKAVRAHRVLAVIGITCLALAGTSCSKQNRMTTNPAAGGSLATTARAGAPQQDLPLLASASNFAVLGGSTVTSTGLSVLTGDLGVSPGTAITGFGPGTVSGAIHAGDATAAQAQADLTTAYNAIAGLPCGTALTGQDLGGMTLAPGVYCFTSSAQLTGTLVLDARGNPGAVFMFQIGSTLTTATNAAVVMINGGRPCNVFWQIGSSATLGTGTKFIGNIVALASITLTHGVGVAGRALARTGAVTMDADTVSVASCDAGPIGGGCSTKVTGGGSIPTSGGFASFGFEIRQRRDGRIQGELEYVSHASKLRLHIDHFTSFVVAGHTATFVGSGTKNGQPGTFTVTVTDDGRSGHSDSFSLAILGGATEAARLRSGNITIHKKHCGDGHGHGDGDDDDDDDHDGDRGDHGDHGDGDDHGDSGDLGDIQGRK